MAAPVKPHGRSGVLVLALAAFAGFGLILVLVGAHQAELSRALELGLSESALLGAALALGAGVGITAAGPGYDRWPRKPLFAAAVCLVALALGSAHGTMSFGGAFARVAIAGIGAGAYNTMVNAAIGERFGTQAGRALAVVHSTATLAAMVGPVLFASLAARGGFVASFRILAGYHLAIAVLALAMPWGQRSASLPAAREPLALGRLWPYLILAFAYVGVEATATLFAVPRAQELGLSPDRGRYAISAFWGGVLVSRLALLASVRLASARGMIGAGLVTCAGAAAAFTAAPGAIELTFAAMGSGIGLVYPLTLALIGARFASARGTATGIAGGAGAAGGFLAPWLAGLASEKVGTGASLALVAAFGLAVAAAASAITRARFRGESR